MAKELKLHSPVGSESVVYTWPIPSSVSEILTSLNRDHIPVSCFPTFVYYTVSFSVSG